jgi:hypothetical protein
MPVHFAAPFSSAPILMLPISCACIGYQTVETPNEMNRPAPPPDASTLTREVWDTPRLIPLDLGNANTTAFTAKHDSDFGPKAVT